MVGPRPRPRSLRSRHGRRRYPPLRAKRARRQTPLPHPPPAFVLLDEDGLPLLPPVTSPDVAALLLALGETWDPPGAQVATVLNDGVQGHAARRREPDDAPLASSER
jgi:hypothetical protein